MTSRLTGMSSATAIRAPRNSLGRSPRWLVVALTDPVDGEEERIDADERYVPDHAQLQQVRRRSAGLRRFLAPQRDIYAQLSSHRRPWFDEAASGYWNELHNHLTRCLEELELIRERVALILES